MNANIKDRKEKSKLKLKIPHTITLLVGIIVCMAALTWIIPSGQFDYVEDAKKPTPIAGTYKQIDKIQTIEGEKVDVRQGISDVLKAPMKGTVAAVDVVAFVLLLGGAFGILTKTGAVEAGIAKIINILDGREIMIIPVAMLLFALGGTTFGMAEETIPFYMIFIPLMLSMGYDSLTGAMIIFLGAQAGVSASTYNPFAVGIAQASAGIPVGSGADFRWIQFAIFVGISIAFVMWYARKVKKDPTSSPMYEIDKTNKEHFLNSEKGKLTEYKWYHGLINLGFALGMILMVYGVNKLGWYMEEICMIFLGIAVFAGIITMIAGDMTEKEMAGAFVEGCKDICFAALVIGVARAILIVAQDGKIIDTILNTLAEALNGLPKFGFIILNFISQIGVSFIVPSTSAHAALTMPLMAPLGDLVKVDRQVIVTAYQYGTGIGHYIFPTQGILMAALGISRVPFQKWLKVVWPLALVLFIASSVFLFVGLQIYPVA